MNLFKKQKHYWLVNEYYIQYLEKKEEIIYLKRRLSIFENRKELRSELGEKIEEMMLILKNLENEGVDMKEFVFLGMDIDLSIDRNKK
ncbi:hypothetical protein IEN91_05015 [Bacillus velezensis]|uniref:hypothetical protein n=1 Tax=Bacillus velezensis TaxID=492670 RepID=UPI0018C84A08|nr:hypothetical protein [Bacillus velezensis]QPK89802.1 hypothetical protein IEN91_05015 [Bacillus velezensis]